MFSCSIQDFSFEINTQTSNIQKRYEICHTNFTSTRLSVNATGESHTIGFISIQIEKYETCLKPVLFCCFSGSTSSQEGRLEKETRRVHRGPPCSKRSSTSRSQRRKTVGSSSASSDGHIRLHPVPSLRKKVQRIRSGSSYSEMQGHQEQQTLNNNSSGH